MDKAVAVDQFIMNIKLLIFDFDGTIMDTKNTIIAESRKHWCQMGKVDDARTDYVSKIQLECLLKWMEHLKVVSGIIRGYD